MDDLNDKNVLSGPQHSAHTQRNLNSPLYTRAGELDSALGIQHTAKESEAIKRDAMGRPLAAVKKAEAAVEIRMKI